MDTLFLVIAFVACLAAGAGLTAWLFAEEGETLQARARRAWRTCAEGEDGPPRDTLELTDGKCVVFDGEGGF